MISFKQFLSEAQVQAMAPGEDISDAELLDFIDEHCGMALIALDSGGPVLYRGFNKDVKLSIMDPSTGERKSENTTNWYTKFFDTNSENTDWPKRSKSFICSTDRVRARSYSDGGEDSTAILLPFDGVKIAEIIADDLWATRLTLGDIETTYTRLNSVWAIMFQTSTVPTFSEAKSMLDALDEATLYERFVDQNAWNYLSADMRMTKRAAMEVEMIEDKGIARKILEDCLENFYTFSKQTNNFKLHNEMGAQDGHHECWFSGKCVVVPRSKWELIQ